MILKYNSRFKHTWLPVSQMRRKWKMNSLQGEIEKFLLMSKFTLTFLPKL